VPGNSDRIKDITSAAEIITGKPARVYCDDDIYTNIVLEKRELRVGLGSDFVHVDECEIHALGSLMHSPISWIDVRIQEGPLAADLFTALEHNRIDRITSCWYDRDMVAASAKHMDCIGSGKNVLAQELLGMLYGEPLSGSFPVLKKYQKSIEAAVNSSSPVKALETAIAIAREAGWIALELPLEDQKEQGELEQSVGQEMADSIQESVGKLADLIDVEEEGLEGSGTHQYRIFHPDMVPFVGMEYCGYVLNQWAGSKPLYKAAIHGSPRYNVWAINYGKTKVFNKRIVSAGKVVVLVDLSASMGGFWSPKQAGYLAFQAANLIAGSTGGSDVDLYGFTGTFTENVIIPLKAGYVPDIASRLDEFPLLGLTPMCVALTFLSSTYQGADAAIAVLITDGNPSAAVGLSQDHVIEHTREIAYNLYEAGMRYLLIQVNTEGLEHLYPAEITLHVNREEDMLQIPMAMSAMMG